MSEDSKPKNLSLLLRDKCFQEHTEKPSPEVGTSVGNSRLGPRGPFRDREGVGGLSGPQANGRLALVWPQATPLQFIDHCPRGLGLPVEVSPQT